MISISRASRYTSVPVKPLPFDVVAAFLRLGLKYNIESLKDEAAARLTHDLPLSLTAFTLRTFMIMPNGHMVESCNSSLYSTINLVRECQCLTHILPVAFYLQACKDLHSFHKPAISNDGREVQLSHEDTCVLSVGWLKLIEAQHQYTYKWLYQTAPISAFCSSKGACFSARANCVLELFTPIPTVSGLDTWGQWATDLTLCAACKVAAKACHDEGRQKIWQMLPSFFGLPEWTELLKE